MNVPDFIAILVRVAFLLVAVLSLVDYLRRPNRTRLEIALLFGCFAPTLLLAELQQILPEPVPWLSTLGSLAIVAQPYVLLRLVHRLRRVPTWIRTAGASGMLASWTILVVQALGSTLPQAVTLLIIVYFGGIEAYCAAALFREGRARAGVARNRMLWGAAGSGWLAAVILLAGVTIVVPGLRPVVSPGTQVLALLSAVSYYLGFTPPRGLRRSWQLGELYRFIRDTSGLGASERWERVLDRLCPAATGAVGGRGSAVWTREVSGSLLLRATDWPGGAADLVPRIETELGQVLALKARRHWRIPTDRVAEAEVGWVEALPIAGGGVTWGVLAVFLRAESLFPEDDLEVLALLAEQTAESLRSADLIAHQKELLEQVQGRIQERESAYRELEAFSYTVSHDLRAPVRTIHGFSQILLKEHAAGMNPEARQLLDRVHAGAGQMGMLIDDFLEFSRLGRQALQNRDIDLRHVVADLVAKLRNENPDRTIDFQVGDLPVCRGDPAMLRAVWTNLLANAVKFTRPRSEARIEVGSRMESEATVFFVRDNGVGFSMDYADKLFGVFQRLHRAEDFEGTGVGLAIVQRVVERHGGKVWAEGREGEGAMFSFSLGGTNGTNGE